MSSAITPASASGGSGSPGVGDPSSATATPRVRRRWWPTLATLWLLSVLGVWGFMASRAASLTFQHQRLELTHDWTHVRMRVLESQTQLTASNFGRAAEVLRDAAPSLGALRTRLDALGLEQVTRQLAEAESQLAIAASLVERQDPAAAGQAAAVVRTLDEVRTAASGAFAPSR